jgi:hypothetical protein
LIHTKNLPGAIFVLAPTEIGMNIPATMATVTAAPTPREMNTTVEVTLLNMPLFAMYLKICFFDQEEDQGDKKIMINPLYSIRYSVWSFPLITQMNQKCSAHAENSR